ncbi:MAG: prepilin-type N-terminal cleavage/methylation domain-containing protein [Candidatus Omnitrophica bacterium]|nr:prepilin-type N-terminal cleavage/methylation domain-containing protein [Candidatus Omnitrophota bacterium]
MAKHQAFSLMEMLIAVMILVLGLCVVLMAFLNSIFLNAANRQLTVASSHADFILEEIKNSDFNTLSGDINNGTWDWSYTDILSFGLTALTNEQIDVSVSGVDELTVSANVSWQERTGRNRNLELSTIIIEP